MSIKNQLKAFEKTDKFKKMLAEKMKSDPKFGNNSYYKAAVQYGDIMKEMLRNEILSITDKHSNESFLDHIIVSEKFIPDTGWTINVSFDEKKTHRDSLYPEIYKDGVLLNEIFNEGYSASDYVYGEWHGEDIRSSRSLPEIHRETMYFIQRAV